MGCKVCFGRGRLGEGSYSLISLVESRKAVYLNSCEFNSVEPIYLAPPGLREGERETETNV